MIPAFPKIFALGTTYIRDIFEEEVEVTEKIDGSQFAFGKVGGELFIRSKGAQLHPQNPEKMFVEGIEYVSQNQHLLPDNIIYYCEYLKKPKHNSLSYERIPKNHLALFGIMDTTGEFKHGFDDLECHSERMGIDRVPVLYRGSISGISSGNFVEQMLQHESVLGGSKIEGVVVKNYHRKFLLGGQPMPLMAGKFVSEEFKEINHKRWNAEEKKSGKVELYYDGFRTEARWEKAFQHLRDGGLLTLEPKDIPLLIKEVHDDIDEESKEDIKEFLYNTFIRDLRRVSTNGLPEWYKKKLMEYPPVTQ